MREEKTRLERLNFAESGLLLVDAQQGFTTLCPEELPVPGALEIVPGVNALLELPWVRVDASQDSHPCDHCSFHGRRDNLYAPHCVTGTRGAEFIPGLRTHFVHAIWRKGFFPDRDAYAITAQHPGFPALLRASGVRVVFVCGLVTNICCYFAALDLRREAFDVYLVEDACAGLDIPEIGMFQDKTKREGMAAGIRYITTADVLHMARRNKGVGSL